MDNVLGLIISNYKGFTYQALWEKADPRPHTILCT